MKKSLALLLALVMLIGILAGCSANTDTTTADSTTAAETAEPADTSAETDTTAAETEETAEPAAKTIETLKVAFVPSREPQEIITATEPLKQLLKDELAKEGYDVGEVEITVGTTYEAVGEGLEAGTIDVGLIPGGTYVLYDDGAEVILTATRDGLSKDSDNAKDWNDGQPTEASDKQAVSYRALFIAGPSDKGQELAAKVNAGEKLTWEDLDKATWAVQKTSSSAGYIYPTLWLMENYDGKKISDLSNVVPLDSGYGTAFSYAAAEQVDIIVCYADGRNDYEASWMLPVDQKDETGKQGMGRSESIWNELNVIGVTDGIYNDTVAISKESPYYTPELIDALQQCFINIINTDEGQAIFSVYSHTGYAIAKDSDYDGARNALKVVS